MTAPVFTTRGRRNTRVRTACLECGQKLEQPTDGRPRLLCGNPECFQSRQRKRRITWAREDFDEAVKNWNDACAFCGDSGSLHPSMHHLPPVPGCHRCYHDAQRQLRAHPAALKRLAYYCANAHRGVPLPRPFIAVQP